MAQKKATKSGNGIEIGDDSMVAAGVVFAPTNHEYLDDSKPIREQGFKKSKGGIARGCGKVMSNRRKVTKYF